MRWSGWIVLLAAALAPMRTFGAEEPASADDVIRRAEQRFAQLTDYECLADTDSRAGKKTAAGTYHLWFKKPEMLRLQVVRGDHRNSEVAVDRDGNVRGREGGLLKPFVVGLKKTDRRLRSIRGVTITQLDWGTFYRNYRAAAAQPGAKTELIRRPGSTLYEVAVTYTQGGTVMRQVYRIDPNRWVLIEADVFEDVVRVDHILFRDIRINTGIGDRWFRL